MKKWILLLFLLILLSIAAIYVFIPSTLQISDAVTLSSPPAAAARGLLQEYQWPKWLNPMPDKSASSREITDKYFYIVKTKFNKELDIEIKKGNQQWPSRLYIVPEVADSISLKWQCSIKSGINPVGRWQQYRNAVALKEDMHRILQQLKGVLEKGENIYGFNFVRTRVTDTVLIATRMSFNSIPTTAQIYKLIKDLRQYITERGAVETGYPMVHHDQIDSKTETMVAIPVNKQLPGKGRFIFKRMVAGYILVAEVKGGPATISKAFDEMENYISDYQKQKIAISFESLVTNREEVSDSAAWITRIYYPIVK
jgi:hypothetical protein